MYHRKAETEGIMANNVSRVFGGISGSVFCRRQIFGTDGLWVSSVGGQLGGREQSMLAISCSLRDAVIPGTIVIDKS